MFKTIFKAVPSSMAKVAPHRLKAFASKSTRDADRARELSPRAEAILSNKRCLSNPTRSYNQHQNALTQLKQNLRTITKLERVVVLNKEQVEVLVRMRMSASEMKSAEARLGDYRIRAERGEDVPELEHFTMMDLELGLHLGTEEWRWKGSTFICAEGIKKAQVKKWIVEATRGIKEPSRGDGIDVFDVFEV